ncbi:hypothetical protein [Chitinophaga filiformis]|uniref:Uncharacterized protein n=1 Tax=Chitinophaga filiformis TaxID=104663 RepID=A0ABY4HZ77_CHIFI|nr:hypothetical protein [Chitinophaga filiformis]UPK69138.1 hypothetical protein MYF79_29705 [Chitinophaga filiformis]
MAIIFEGLSKCVLCGQKLNCVDEITAAPPLTSNTKDPLFVFSDAGMHVACLDGHPLKDSLFYQIEQLDNVTGGAKARCIVDGNLITHPGDMLALGMLTSDLNEPLAAFNFIILNRNNRYRWNRREEFISLAEEFILNAKWEPYGPFDMLKYIMKELA